jgi:hypothetical protein
MKTVNKVNANHLAEEAIFYFGIADYLEELEDWRDTCGNLDVYRNGNFKKR